MKKILMMIVAMAMIASLMSLVGCGSATMQALPDVETLSRDLVRDGYELVFEDNFDGDELDRTHWSTGFGGNIRRGGYYVDDAVFVEDGNLIIRTDYRKEGIYGPGWYTGWVESGSKSRNANAPADYEGVSKRYGYFEARCKAPATQGIWSAFWFMPDRAKGANGMTGNDTLGTGADGVEIDVMESLHYANRSIANANQHVIHSDGYAQHAQTEASPHFNMGDMYNEFHTYGLMWTESEYIFYIDGVETWRTEHKVGDVVYGTPNVEEYMLLTVEIAGVARDGVLYPGKDFGEGGKLVPHWAGNPSANNKSRSYDFVIDHVRVYQR